MKNLAAGMGLLAAFTIHFSHAIWYHFPLAYVLTDGTTAFIGTVTVGTAIALLCPRTAQITGATDRA